MMLLKVGVNCSHSERVVLCQLGGVESHQMLAPRGAEGLVVTTPPYHAATGTVGSALGLGKASWDGSTHTKARGDGSITVGRSSLGGRLLVSVPFSVFPLSYL